MFKPADECRNSSWRASTLASGSIFVFSSLGGGKGLCATAERRATPPSYAESGEDAGQFQCEVHILEGQGEKTGKLQLMQILGDHKILFECSSQQMSAGIQFEEPQLWLVDLSVFLNLVGCKGLHATAER